MYVMPNQSVPDLDQLYLEDSTVRAILYHGDRLTFEVLAHVLPTSPHHRPPILRMRASYRPATISILGVSRLLDFTLKHSLAMEPDFSIDLGTFDGFHVSEGRYTVHGLFGRIELLADRATFDVTD